MSNKVLTLEKLSFQTQMEKAISGGREYTLPNKSRQ